MKPLLQLLASNRQRGLFRAESGADEATLYLYDVVVASAEEAAWYGGVDPLTFVKELSAITAPVIHLRINCPGGDVFAARAIEQAIREHPATIIAHIDGYAASAASYIALAADEVIIAEGAMYMIHKAWTMAYGNANDLIEVAELLEKVDGTLVATYVQETGQTAEQITQWMADETWFTADEAVQYGFADKCATPDKKKKAESLAQWDLSAYAHAPALADTPAEDPDEAPDAAPPAPTFTNTDHLRRRLELIAKT